jgi:hypothetical protein
MDSAAFLRFATHLVMGAFATFAAILLWSKTRDMAWTFLIIAAILSYADIVLQTLGAFGILPGEFLQGGNASLVLQLALANLPPLFTGIGFLVASSRRRQS